MNLVGKTAVFISYDDTAWGEQYAGKECKVIEYTYSPEYEEVRIEFKDGQKLVAGVNEIEILD